MKFIVLIALMLVGCAEKLPTQKRPGYPSDADVARENAETERIHQEIRQAVEKRNREWETVPDDSSLTVGDKVKLKFYDGPKETEYTVEKVGPEKTVVTWTLPASVNIEILEIHRGIVDTDQLVKKPITRRR